MTKRFIPAALAAIALAVATSGASAQAQKVGFVNSQRVLAEAPAIQTVQQTLEREFTPTRASIDSLGQRVQTGQQQLQQQAATLSATVRQQREQELQTLYAQYQQRGQQAQQALQRREAELMQPVMATISQAVEAERTAGGFAYILDTASSLVVSVDPSFDLTDRVLTRLGRPAGGAPR